MIKQLCTLLLCLPMISFVSAQDDTSTGLRAGAGIKWTTGLSWEQIKQKAKQENKYVFLDFYTTWCGPCKMMDNSVYINDSVGGYFNDRFISVKVQMDKTDKDNDNIKSWYADAEAIGKEIHIEGYPTFICLTPQGGIIHRAMGYMPPDQLIGFAKTAITPGRIYNDEFVLYDEFVKSYKSGAKDYDKYPAMIKTAFKANDTAIAYPLLRELNSYVAGLPLEQRYTKDRIEMWAGFGISSKQRVFQFFYKEGKQIDKVMEQKGYAAEVVDRTIQAEICHPFMEEQSKNSGIAMDGMYLNGPGLEENMSEANWRQLYSLIKGQYGRSYARRSVITARIEWYGRYRNHQAFTKYSLIQLKQYPPDTSKVYPFVKLNTICWTAFLKCADKKILNECINWMKRIEHYPQAFQMLDTYANLLYKVGRKEEAIKWQQLAASAAPGDKGIRSALENMRLNQPTYISAGASWEGIKTINWNGFVFKKWVLVNDATGKPIKGASVVNARSGEAKLSDENGYASMQVSIGDIIAVSVAGYNSKETTVNKRQEKITVLLN